MNIFHIDWITVDIVIILLLFILLVSVRVYAYKTRWWSKNKSDVLRHNVSMLNFAHQFSPNIKDCLVINPNKNVKGSIIVLEKRKRLFFYNILVALTKMGFNVIIIRINSKFLAELYNRSKSTILDLNRFAKHLSNTLVVNTSREMPIHCIIYGFKRFSKILSKLFSLNLHSLVFLNPNNTLINKVKESTERQPKMSLKANILVIVKNRKYLGLKKNKRQISTILREIPDKYSFNVIYDAKISFRQFETIIFVRILNVLYKSLKID